MPRRLALGALLLALQCCGCTAAPRPKTQIVIPEPVPPPDPSECRDGGGQRIRRCRDIYWIREVRL